jgi:lysophospholipase L1-like esterase
MKKSVFALLFTVFISNYITAQTVRPFKAGDRVVFVGNSITDGGHYHSYIWLYYLTHLPYTHIQIFNAGIGGDIAQQIYERLDSDVFAKKPTVITLTFGMNDTGYQLLHGAKADSAYDGKIATSLKSFKLIETKLKQYTDVSEIMIGSSPYDETSRTKTVNLVNKNAAMRKIAASQELVAKNNHWYYMDFGAPMTAINLREQKRDSLFTLQGSDRIHPTNDAQMIMAWLFLKSQGLAGNKVANVSINVKNKTIESAQNCTIVNPLISTYKINFTYLAKSLPYPIDTIPGGFGRPQKAQLEALKIIPFTDQFNQEILQVKGLKAKRLSLKIDSSLIGVYSAEEYAHGINLATITSTPQYQQALAVMHLNEERWTIERRLREYYWIHYSILKPKGLLFKDGGDTVDSLKKYAKKDFFVAATLSTYQKARFKAVRDAWQKEIDLLINELYTINQPVPHRFEITAIN